MTAPAALSSEYNNNVNSLSLRQALDYCLDILKIKDDSECYRNVAQAKIPLAIIKTHGNWITALKLIASCSRIVNYDSSDNDNHVFSQIQLYDFLTLAARVIEKDEKEQEQERVAGGRQVNVNTILKIMGDIMENYENFGDRLKSNYPSIIVDVISVLHNGVDTKGSKISSISIDKYYQSRKQQGAVEAVGKVAKVVAAAATTTRHKDQSISLSSYSSEPKEEALVQSLFQITNRRREDIEQLLGRLTTSDLKKIRELCHNYNRLQKYSRLITEGSEQEFKKEIEREIGRKLGPHQLWRAANSVKRVRTYIENILDNKFIPDISHGINHVKHNLEYGYQLMDLIDCRRQKSR
ncbi:MAG: hypothetical protein JO297_10610 [Nitrososphaeraceae archaeon]|nr:hypothetical protein [Nitrososphaeraceae archaeon]